MIAIYLSVLSLCLAIFYQDIKHREVSSIFFLLLAIAGTAINLLQPGGFRQLAINTGINLFICLLLLAMLKLYFLIKEKKLNSIVNTKIGAGDIYFLIACSFFFSPILFCVFLMLSLLFSLLTAGFSLLVSNPSINKNSIPLAGLQSLCLIAFIAICLACKINITDDELITRYLYPYE